MSARSLVVALAATTLLSLPTLAGTGPAGFQVTVDAEVGGCEMTGTAAPNVSFKLKHLSAAGTLKGKTTVTASGTTEWVRPCPAHVVAVGDRLEFRYLGESEPFRTFRVPRLRVVTDRVIDRVRGSAPGVSSIELALLLCDATGFGCTKAPAETVTTDPETRAFSWDTTFEATGLASVVLDWARDGDHVSLTRHFAVMVVELGSGRATGSGSRVGRRETVSLRRGQAIGLTTPTTDAAAAFRGTFKRNGSVMKARRGDLVSSSIAGDASMTIPDVSLTVSGSGTKGSCFKERPVTVRYKDATGQVQHTAILMTDLSRNWVHDQVIGAGWRVDVWCVNGKGDQVRLHQIAD